MLILSLIVSMNVFSAQDDCGSTAFKSDADYKAIKKQAKLFSFLSQDPNRELVAAVEDGSIKRAKKWLEKGASPDTTVENNRQTIKTVLFIAIENHDVEMLKLLLSYDASYVAQKDGIFQEDNSPLVVAMRRFIWTKLEKPTTDEDKERDRQIEEVLTILFSGKFKYADKNCKESKCPEIDYDQSAEAKKGYYVKFGVTGERTLLHICHNNGSSGDCLEKLYTYTNANQFPHKEKFLSNAVYNLRTEFVSLYLENNKEKISTKELASLKSSLAGRPDGQAKTEIQSMLDSFVPVENPVQN